MNSGIYRIASPSGRVYIGSAVDFDKRWATHRYQLRKGRHHSPALQHAYDKYGESALKFQRILLCAPADLLMYEQLVIDAFPAGELYNVSPVVGSQLGFKHRAETRAKYSETRKGRKMPPRSADHVEKIAAKRRGQPLSEQARANQSAAQRGRPKTPEHVAKVAAANRGKKRSKEICAAIGKQHANRANARNTCGFAGVTKRGARWLARVSVDGRRVHVGLFATAAEAGAAVQARIVQIQNGANP